jgi:hypothetical protein
MQTAAGRWTRALWLALPIAIPLSGADNNATPSPAPAAPAAHLDWPAALAGMPVPERASPLTRSNAVRLIVEHFRSNDVVRAIVFHPGVPDDFYLIHRDQPIGPSPSPSSSSSSPGPRVAHLAEAIRALTNFTTVRATFAGGVLHLHTDSDRLDARPGSGTMSGPLRLTLEQRRGLGRAQWVDAHWKSVQPALARAVRQTIRPGPDSQDAWHFERVNLVADGLTDWELLNLVALATGTRLSLAPRAIVFER